MNIARSLGAGFLTSMILFAVSASAAQYDFQRSRLENGLTVISLEDQTCPIVAVQVWYHVGSKDEHPERQGFAHMFEHMMFRGTDQLGSEGHFDYVRGTGGNCNAFTSFDNTTYVNVLPASQLELALWLEAERMAFLKIDEIGFHKERAVVEEERRLRSLNTPYGTVMEKLLPALFKKHPYRWTPIGQIPHLRAATIEELQGFWDRYYVPSNATLVVVGDVKHAEVHRLAKQYFGWIPRCPDPPRIDTKEPEQQEPRKITIEEQKGPAPIVGLVYRTVPQRHKDALPLEMLMSIMGGGESSRIYKDLVKKQKVAEFAVAGAFGLEDDGIAGAGAVLMPWGDKSKALSVIREHVARVKEEGVTEPELEKVRNQFLRNEVTRSLTIASKANMLGAYETLEGGAEKANTRLTEIRGVTVDDLKRVANHYLVESRETTALVQPQMGGMLKSLLGFGGDVDEGAKPVPEPETNRVAKRGGCRADLKRPDRFPEQPPIKPVDASAPSIEHHRMTLDNGLGVVVVPNHEVPFVTVTLGVLNGAWSESKPGVASMAAGMITKGSENHDAAQLAQELEFNAISLGAMASLDTLEVNASCVTDKFDQAVRLMSEVVRTPTFPQEEFDVMRQQTLLGLMVQAATPEYLADREFRRRLFGPHPYARTAVGEPEEVRAISTDDMKRWWQSHVRPEQATLYIAGDVDAEEAVSVARGYFGGWKVESPVVQREVPKAPAPSSTQIFLVDRPGSVQSQIRVGLRSITRKDEGYFAGRVMSQILGGGFNSRLNKAIRVDRGLTYGARGGLSPERFDGTLTISTFTKTPSTAETLQVILDELNRMRDEAVASDELGATRSYLIGSFAGDRETPQAVVRDLWMIEYADLPADFLNRFLSGVKDTSQEAVQDQAKRLIDKEHLTIVVVGEAAKVKEDLEKIAPVTVVKESGSASSEEQGTNSEE